MDRALMIGSIAAGALAVWWFLIRPARAVADAYKPGGLAYEAGDAVQDAIVPGSDSLGTWLYGLLHPNEYDPTAPTPLPKPRTAQTGGASGSWDAPLTPYDYGAGPGTGPLRPQLLEPDPSDPFAFWGLS